MLLFVNIKFQKIDTIITRLFSGTQMYLLKRKIKDNVKISTILLSYLELF